MLWSAPVNIGAENREYASDKNPSLNFRKIYKKLDDSSVSRLSMLVPYPWASYLKQWHLFSLVYCAGWIVFYASTADFKRGKALRPPVLWLLKVVTALTDLCVLLNSCVWGDPGVPSCCSGSGCAEDGARSAPCPSGRPPLQRGDLPFSTAGPAEKAAHRATQKGK